MYSVVLYSKKVQFFVSVRFAFLTSPIVNNTQKGNRDMENEKIIPEVIAEEPEKNSVSFWRRAKETIVKAVDQNNDGSFDMKDVSVLAGTIGSAAKSTAAAVMVSAEEKSRELERKQLRPIFAEDLDGADFLISKLIRITDIDKKRAESTVCTGSVGFITPQKDFPVVNIFRDKIDSFGLTFYPDMDYELYYVDPSDRDRYIALDEYFSYLKIARVNELQRIAQDLGAKHFRVTFKEQKATFSGNSVKAKASFKKPGDTASAEAEHEMKLSATSTIEVAAEMDCPGHAPVKPTLRYLQRDPSIENLIALRMDEASPITHHKLTLNFSQTSGIKEKDAVKIDAALKAMKISGNTTVTNEVRNESRRFFEYEIDF